jgi:cell pole-organizing protein PopZ
MSKTSGQKDPSMDEILGSIRRIITEDNAQSGQPDVSAEDAQVATDDDILDLTDALETTGEQEERREPVLKPVEAGNGDEGPEAQGERREPVLGIHSPAAAAPVAEPPVAKPEAATEIPPEGDTPGQEEEPAMAVSDEPAPQAEQPQTAGETIVSETTSSATTAALGELSRAVEEKAGRLRLGEGDATVSDIVKELLRPMLSEWIDENLPPIVERVVRREIQKLVDRAPSDD